MERLDWLEWTDDWARLRLCSRCLKRAERVERSGRGLGAVAVRERVESRVGLVRAKLAGSGGRAGVSAAGAIFGK